MKNQSVSILDIDFNGLEYPLYKSLSGKIADFIENGKIGTGEFLPSRKVLASHLGISVQTVREAYEDLDLRGYVVGEVGRGTRVMDRPEGFEWNTIVEEQNESIIDLSILKPVFGPRHAAAIEATLSDVVRQRDFSMFAAYRPSSGLKQHKLLLSKWLTQYGVDQHHDQLLITSGATHAGFLALSSTCEPGNSVLTTSLTDVGVIGICRSLGLILRGLPFDKHGIAAEDFERACEIHRPKALILTPTMGNPYPFTIPGERRRAIAEVAKRFRVTIIEDDCFRPLLNDGPTAFKTLLPDQTIYLTTFSKVLMSGMRVGCAVPPPALYSRMAARLRGTTWMTAPIMVELVTRWIEDGTASSLVEWQRSELIQRQKIVRTYLPDDLVISTDAGLNCWLELPAGWRASDFVAAAAQSDIAVTSPDAFRIDDLKKPDGVRLCIGSARTNEDLRSAMERLSGIIQHPSDFVLDFA